MKSTYSDVVVVGAGPAGLVLSEVLARAGLGVTIVERQTDPTQSSQGALLQPVTLDLLGRLFGLPHSMSDSGSVVGIEEVAPCGRIFTGYFSQLSATPTDYAVNVSQGELRAFLLDRVLRAPSVTVRTGTTIVRLDEDRPGRCSIVVSDVAGDRGAEILRSSWIVAADGKASATRKLADIDAVLSDFPHRLYLLSMPTPAAYPQLIRAHRNDKGMVTTVPGGSPGRTYLFVHTLMDDSDPVALIADTVSAVRAGDPRLAGAAVDGLAGCRIVDLRPQLVHTRSWRQNGVVLLGDSAHGMHNIGGQGINTSMQDALVLGAILACGDGDESIYRVDEFEGVRRPYIEGLQRAQSELGSGFWSSDAASWFAPRFEELSLGQRDLRTRLAALLAERRGCPRR